MLSMDTLINCVCTEALETGVPDKRPLTRTTRLWRTDVLLDTIASCGRKFFHHDGRVARFEVDARGRVWFIDAYSQRRIYTHTNHRWRGFSNGGTLRSLVERLRNYIRTGEKLPALTFGPWSQWYCDGDLWGYGDDMAYVRQVASELDMLKARAGEIATT